jgi:serine/threonine protein kinase
MAGLEGRTLDRYQLQRITGRGGMADVYLGYDTRFDREVAVKVFKRDDDDLLQRFVREARLMASLHYPHLMPVYDAGESALDGVPIYYIVMPFMGGGTLRARIRRGALPLTEACRILHSIADALDYVHKQGIVHRDIKSSNVLLDADDKCYLSDFGIARATTDATNLTTTGSVLGTVDYVAPELFEPNHRADALSDLYSLGVLAFEMITGRLPFVADSQIALVTMQMTKRPPAPSSIVASIPPQLDRVILKALAKKPEQRYSSGAEFAEAFCAVITRRTNGLRNDGLVVDGIPPVATVAPDAPTVAAAQPVFSSPARPAVSTRPVGSELRQSSAPTGPTGSTVRRRRRLTPQQRQARVVTVLALLALLAVVGPITYVALTHAHGSAPGPGPGENTSTTPDYYATAQAGATATYLAQNAAVAATQQAQNATATAIVAPTVTAQAKATAQAVATVGILQTATAGQPVYSDKLNNVNNPATQAANWDQDSHCAFQSDGYHVINGALDELHGCKEASYTYQNATIGVDVVINNGATGGLFFRIQVSSVLQVFSGYVFEIDTQGNYRIYASHDFSNPLDPVILQDWTQSSALKTGNAKNRLEVIINGGIFLFYINGTFVAEVQNSTYSSAGLIAFLATGPNADVAYSNLKVYPYPPT